MQGRSTFLLATGLFCVLLIVGTGASPNRGVRDVTQSQYSTGQDSSLNIVTLSPSPSPLAERAGHIALGGHSENDFHEEAPVDGHHGEKAHAEGIHVFIVDFPRVETPFIIALWIFCASLAKIGFHMAPKLSQIFPESCLLIVVGIAIGLLLFHTNSVGVLPLTPNTFFFYMLPPIILDAGYFMPNRAFFDHLGTILLFAVIGTLWNTITIGLALWGVGLTGVYGMELPLLDTFLFSSLISAVDPVAVLAVFEEIHVNEILYIIVFGESLLNDAVTVVLYKMFDVYVGLGAENVQYTDVLAGVGSFLVTAVGGTLIGVIWGFLTGFVTRFTNHVLIIEPIFIFVMSYLAYLNAEIFHMSGILAITFCGITMKNYVEGNISPKSHTTVKYAMKMLSSSSETIIFMFLGVNTIHDQHDWNTPFILLTILFCSAFRAIGCIVLTHFANQFRLHKLNHVEKFVMSYGGLRGAVAFALVLLIDKKKVPLQPLFVTATISVVYFTVFFQGITIKPLVKFLKVKRANKFEKTMSERIHEKLMDYTMAGMEDILGSMGNLKIRDKFKQIDNRYIRPCLIREHKAHEPKILETYSKLTMRDAMEFMRRNGSTVLGAGPAGESMAVLFRNYTANNLQNSGSVSQIDQGWNLDIGELAYSPSARDLSDAKVHHMLSEESWKPYRRSVRRLSYSRHPVITDRDTQLSYQLNHNMHMHIRRMVSETVRKQHSKRIKRHRDPNGSVSKSGNKSVSFEALKENGSSKKLHDDYLHTVIKEVSEAEERSHSGDESQRAAGSTEDLDGAITFTARKTSLRKPKTGCSSGMPPLLSRSSSSYQDDVWEGEGEMLPSTPSAVEMQMPWKHDDDYDSGMFPVKQSEFPLWVENKEYTNYYSPTNTFLGGLDRKDVHPSVIDMFERETKTEPCAEDCSSANGACASSPSFIVTVTIPEEDTSVENTEEEVEDEDKAGKAETK